MRYVGSKWRIMGLSKNKFLFIFGRVYNYIRVRDVEGKGYVKELLR